MIKAYLCGEQEDWDLNLGRFARAHRATQNGSTGITPNLTISREVRLLPELVYGSFTCMHGFEVVSYGDYAHALQEALNQQTHNKLYFDGEHIGVISV